MEEKLLLALIDSTDDKNISVISEWMASKEAELNTLKEDEYIWLKSEYYDALKIKERRQRSFNRLIDDRKRNDIDIEKLRNQ